MRGWTACRVAAGPPVDHSSARRLVWHYERGIALARSGIYDALITVDRNLSFQQNVSRFQLAIVVLLPERIDLLGLKPLVPELLQVLEKIQPGKLYLVPAQQ